MKIVDLEQNSDAWMDWRRTHWTASEAAVVMDATPYYFETRAWDDLRLQKAGLAEEPSESARIAFSHGHKHEPAARKFLAGHGYGGEPVCVESESEPKLAASLDAYNARDGWWAEIKCPLSARSKLLSVTGWEDLPPWYQWQVLHQWAVLRESVNDGLHCLFLAYLPSGQCRLCKWRFPDDIPDCDDRVAALLAEWRRFDAGGPQTPADPEWSRAAATYRTRAAALRRAREDADEAKAHLVRLAGGKPRQGDGVSVSLVKRTGAVDVDALTAAGVDIPRKPGSESWTVRVA